MDSGEKPVTGPVPEEDEEANGETEERGSAAGNSGSSAVPVVTEQDEELRGTQPRQGPCTPDMMDTARRLQTFSGWGRQHALQLAEAGFFYTGKADSVECFYCSGALRIWACPDDPMVEHARWFPYCPFISGLRGSHRFQQYGVQPGSSLARGRENDHAVGGRQLFRVPVQESCGVERGQEETFPPTEEQLSESGLADRPPIQETDGQARSDQCVGHAHRVAEPPAVRNSRPSQRRVVADTRCVHCQLRERKVQQDCGHRTLCYACFFCRRFWIHHLDRYGNTTCLECFHEFHAVSLPRWAVSAFQYARHYHRPCGCESRRG